MFGIVLYDSDSSLNLMRKKCRCRSCYNSWWQREFYLLSVIRYYTKKRKETRIIMREMLGKFADKHGGKMIDEILDGKWIIPFPILQNKIQKRNNVDEVEK